jgi:hypothetical protein
MIHLPLFDKDFTGIDAITLGPAILCWVTKPSEKLIKHEQVHVEQWKRQPFTFHVRYFLELFRNKWKGLTWRESYLMISYEVQAREKSNAI